MKLSTKCRYGLRAAIDIAGCFGKVPAKRKDIAKKQDLSSSYLENILLVLRNHDIIRTARGVNGGYVLCRKPSEITAYDIVNALEGPLSLVECIDKPKSCRRSAECASRIVWEKLAGAFRTSLGGITLQDLLDREKKSGAIDYAI